MKGIGKLPLGILIIVTLIHSIFVYTTSIPKELNASLDSIRDFSQNWDIQPIVDLKVVAGNDVCPEGYTNGIGSSWPGLKNGCWCENLMTLEDSTCAKN